MGKKSDRFSLLSVGSTRSQDGCGLEAFLAPIGVNPRRRQQLLGGRANRQCCIKECLKIKKLHETIDSLESSIKIL